MIRLYSTQIKQFTNNGIKIMKPLKALVTKEDNGDYFLEVEDVISNLGFYIQGYILLVDTPWGKQGFRIGNVEKKNSRISFKAYHLYYDTADYVILDANIVDKNCNYALDYLNTNCDATTPFTTSSNITTVKSFRPVRKSLEEAVNMCLENYGGHLIRDNFSIKINDTIGQDKGVTLAYGKNITDMDAKENWDDVCTKIMPYTTYNQKVYKLSDAYVTSSVQYDKPYTKCIEFQNELDDDDYKDDSGKVNIESYETALLAWLRQKAVQYLNEHKYPLVNYTVKAHMDNITDVGDTIRVKHPKMQVELTTNVIKVQYDAINMKYKEIEFGNFKSKLSNLITNFENTIRDIKDEFSKSTKSIITQSLDKKASDIINSMNGYNLYQKDKMLAMDTDNISTARKILMINKEGIAFGTNGIDGTFNGALTIDGKMNFQVVEALNLLASMIRCDNLKVGHVDGQDGNIEVLDSSGNTIITLDKNGALINNGKLIVKNSNGQVVIDGSKRVFQMYNYGSGYLHMDANECTKTITIPHNMNYQPSFHAEFMEYNEGATEERAIHMSPYMKCADTVDSFGHYWLLPAYIAEMYADSTNLYVRMKRSSDASISEGWGIYYRYYIFISYQI